MNINQLIQQIKIPLLTIPSELEYFTIHQERYKIILKEIIDLRLPVTSNALDIGCFPLHLYSVLEWEPFEFKMSGIASNHEPVKQKNIKQLNIEKDTFPFQSDSFNLVLMTEVIEHLIADPRVYLSEIKRVLKPNGYLLITTPNAAHLKNRMKLLAGKSSHFPLDQLFETNINDDSRYHRHNREFTLSELKTILTNTQYDIQSAEYKSFYTPFRSGKKFNLISAIGFGITQLYSPLKDSILIVAKK